MRPSSSQGVLGQKVLLSKTPAAELATHGSALLNPTIHQEVIYEKVKTKKTGNNLLLQGRKRASTRPQSVDMSA